MKRILYLTFYFRPDLCAGSFRNSPLVDEIATQIQDKDIQVDVLTTSPNRYSTFREEYKEHEQIGNVSIERIVVPEHESGVKDQIMSFKTYFFEVLKRTRKRNYDLVFASSSRFFTSYLGYLIAKRNQTPLYLDVRDIFSETVGNISKNPLVKHLIAPIAANRECKVYHYATHINLISEGFRDNFKHYTSTHFSYFTHGVDPVFKKAQKNNNSKKSQTKTILYAGNIGDGQGLHKIVPQAAKQLKEDYIFRIIGDGGAMQAFTNKLRKLNIKNVELVEPMNREGIVDEYINADILLIHLNNLPIFKKVLPSKVFELATVQKPILAGVNGYAQSFLKENVEGAFLFNPGDVNGLLEAIKHIEKFLKEGNSIDNSRFIAEFDRQSIKQEMANSILSYLN